MPFISRCCARQSATTSGEPNGSGPERIERRVEWNGGHFLPHAVLEADHERLVDVELDSVARAPRAVHGEAPLVVRDDSVETAPIRPAGRGPRTPEELDDLATAPVLAAHRRVPRDAPQDVATERSGDLLCVLAE